MLTQASAFVIRSLRQEARMLTHHLVRGCMVLMMVLAFFVRMFEASRIPAGGLGLISTVTECWYWCLLLLGSSYFSAAIAEEKEEETLPLLQMTGVRTITLLLGKSLPRLMVILLLMLVAAPLLLFSQTLGGVLTKQIVALLMGFMAFAFCLSQAGLLAGVVCRDTRRAVPLMILLWMLLEFGSLLVWMTAAACDEWGWGSMALIEDLHTIRSWWWQRSMWSASETYLLLERGETLWNPQITFHLCCGLVLLFVSWLLFEPCTRAARVEGRSDGVEFLQAVLFGKRRMSPRRAVEPALVWKSWQTIVGGWPWFWISLIGLPVIIVGVVLLCAAIIGQRVAFTDMALCLFWGGIILLLVQVVRGFGSVLNREVFQQTLVSLCMLPKERVEMVRELLAGVLPVAIPPLACAGFGGFIAAVNERWFLRELGNLLAEPWTWTILAWIPVTLAFGMLLSLYVRHGAMLLAIAINWIAVPVCGGTTIAILLSGSGGGPGLDSFLRYIVPVGLWGVEVVILLFLVRMIVQRVEDLAGR